VGVGMEDSLGEVCMCCNIKEERVMKKCTCVLCVIFNGKMVEELLLVFVCIYPIRRCRK
jgi:hypothetical protein